MCSAGLIPETSIIFIYKYYTYIINIFMSIITYVCHSAYYMSRPSTLHRSYLKSEHIMWVSSESVQVSTNIAISR